MNRYLSSFEHNNRPAIEKHRVVFLPAAGPALEKNVEDENIVVELGVWNCAQSTFRAKEASEV